MCRLAILAFWKAFYKCIGRPFNEARAGRYAFDDAEYLATKGDEGLRYGAPGWPHLKLRYTRARGFYLDSNDMELEEFLEFQEAVAEQFQGIGLPFYKIES